MNLCVFPFKGFIVLSLIFRSLIYFELSFLHGIRQGSNFILLPVNIQLSPALFVKKTILFLLKHISTILFISFLLSFHTLLIILVKNFGVGSHFFPQGIFLTQKLNSSLLQCTQILYCLTHQGNQKPPVYCWKKKIMTVNLLAVFLILGRKLSAFHI